MAEQQNIQKKNNSFKNFTKADGLQDNEFNIGAYLKLKNGDLLIGGINGFNLFTPNEILLNPLLPEVVFSELKIFNKPIRIGQAVNGNVILTKALNETEKITLSNDENFFSIEFAALHYVNPNKNKYSYMLEGFHSGWINADKNREATFTNLDAGEYKFRVKASNSDGIWNESGTTLRIEILPPWWQTRLFIIIAILLILTLSVSLHFFKIERIKERNLSLYDHNVELNVQIRERKSAEEKLINSKQNLVDILNSVSSVYICVDKNSKIIYLNAEAEKFAAIKDVKLIGENIQTVFPQLSSDTEIIKEVINKGRTRFLCRKVEDDFPHKIEIAIYPLRKKTGKGAVLRIDRTMDNT
ncbi:MAG: hypothetical protein JEY94_06950 [Melioribacteraceae bacterium]|nr:hypothetical protein [Melioribacteraceae bacterium]